MGQEITMSIGSINIASTPCCGMIQRSYECEASEISETGWTHTPGGDYAPKADDYPEVQNNLDKGVCPDCHRSMALWLENFGHLDKKQQNAWRWNFSQAQKYWGMTDKDQLKFVLLNS